MMSSSLDRALELQLKNDAHIIVVARRGAQSDWLWYEHKLSTSPLRLHKPDLVMWIVRVSSTTVTLWIGHYPSVSLGREV